MGAIAMKERPTGQYTRQMWLIRGVYAILAVAVIYYYDTLQAAVDNLYAYLLSTWVFNSAYFETWWVTVCYISIVFSMFVTVKLRILDRYKIDPNMKWEHGGAKTYILEGIVYCGPIMVLDTFLPKIYKNCGVDPKEWEIRKASWIQHTRALPIVAPTVGQIIFQLVVSIILYDAAFFAIHFVLHKHAWLYKYLHAEHHDHTQIHSKVTNKLSIPERLILVGSANYSLKAISSHPLTRVFFVPIFIALLVENHSGYDMPWTLDKVVPFGLVGGSPKHYAHHVDGAGNYQPFFTYIDKWLGKDAKKTR